MTDHIEALRRTASELKQNAFAAKLTFDERMALYTIYKMGYPVSVLISVFNVHKSTVNHVVNAHSKHYKKVRATFIGMGQEAAEKQYVTPEIAAKVQAAASSAPKNVAEAVKPLEKPSRRADASEGGPYKSGLGEEFYVRWDDDPPVGWYCVFNDDLVGDPNTGLPFNTSTQARQGGERM